MLPLGLQAAGAERTLNPKPSPTLAGSGNGADTDLLLFLTASNVGQCLQVGQGGVVCGGVGGWGGIPAGGWRQGGCGALPGTELWTRFPLWILDPCPHVPTLILDPGPKVPMWILDPGPRVPSVPTYVALYPTPLARTPSSPCSPHSPLPHTPASPLSSQSPSVYAFTSVCAFAGAQQDGGSQRPIAANLNFCKSSYGLQDTVLLAVAVHELFHALVGTCLLLPSLSPSCHSSPPPSGSLPLLSSLLPPSPSHKSSPPHHISHPLPITQVIPSPSHKSSPPLHPSLAPLTTTCSPAPFCPSTLPPAPQGFTTGMISNFSNPASGLPYPTSSPPLQARTLGDGPLYLFVATPKYGPPMPASLPACLDFISSPCLPARLPCLLPTYPCGTSSSTLGR